MTVCITENSLVAQIIESLKHLGGQKCQLYSCLKKLGKRRFRKDSYSEGKVDSAACVPCNKCFATAADLIPVYCYNKGFPK
jgi:hypothetical protein